MALTLPYPDMDFVPLDILTAAEMNELVANIEFLANQLPVATTNITDAAVTTAKIADNAVTSGKISLTTATDAAGFTQIDLGNIRIYGKKGTSSQTVSGSAWKEFTASTKPTNLSTSHKFYGTVSAKSSDNALSANGTVATTGGSTISLVNNYSQSVSATITWQIIIIEVVA